MVEGKNILIIANETITRTLKEEIKNIDFLNRYIIHEIIPESDTLCYSFEELQKNPPELVILHWVNSMELQLIEFLKFLYVKCNSAGVILLDKEQPDLVDILYSISVNFLILLTPITSKQLELACYSAFNIRKKEISTGFSDKYENRQIKPLFPIYKENGKKPSIKLIGISPYIRKVREEIVIIGDSDIPVAIEGESGTGKEIIARELHNHSKRKDKPFLAVNCATLGTLADTELFGQIKGAFTGAVKSTHGYIGTAEGGTLFLDEIEQLSSDIQAKLLRFLDSGEYMKVGDSKLLHGNVRIICASNKPFVKLTEQGLLRSDFFYRISGAVISTLPLRKRKEDIPLLVDYFIERFNIKFLRKGLPEEMYSVLYDYHWPGNIRELKNFIRQLSVRGRYGKITRELACEILGLSVAREEKIKKYKNYQESKKEAIEKHDKKYFSSLLTLVKGNTAKAIELSGMHKKNFYKKLNDYNIVPANFRPPKNQ